MAKTKFLSKVLAVLLALSMLCSTGVFANVDAEGSIEPVLTEQQQNPAISVTYTPTLNKYFAFNGKTSTKERVQSTKQTKDFAAGPQEYIVTVPYGTESVTVEPITTELDTVEGFTLDFKGKDSAETSFKIDDFTYDVTFRWEHDKPYIYGITYDASMPERYIVLRGSDNGYSGSDNGYIGYSTNISPNISDTTQKVTVTNQLAWDDHKTLSLTVNGKAISKAYSTVFALSNFDNFVNAGALKQLANPGKVGWNPTDKWISFKASDAGTVYVQMSHANAKEDDFEWKEGKEKGWTKETNVTGTDSVIYSLSFNAEDTVNIPSQVVTKEEIDYVNAQLQVAYPADGAYQFMYKLVNGNGYAAQLSYSIDDKEYNDLDKTWTKISAGTTSATKLGETEYRGAYYRCANNTGLLIEPYGYETFVVVAFDEPVVPEKLYYKIDNGEPEEIEILADNAATVAFDKCITGAISLEGTHEGDGYWVYGDPITLDENNIRGEVTATLKNAIHEEIAKYTITFIIPEKPAISVKFTPTLNKYFAFKGDGATKERKTYTEPTVVNFAEGPQEYIVTVPYGTESVTVAPIETALGTVEGFTLDFTGKDFAETSFEIGGFTYDVTFEWEHDKPYIYNVSYHGVFPERYIVLRGSDNGYIGYSTATGNITDKTESVSVDQNLAWNDHDTLSLTVNGKAISKAYSTVFSLGRFDNFVHAEALKNLANPGKVGWKETENWISFKASDAGTVYVQMSHANANEPGFEWEEAKGKGWTKETKVTGTDSVIYSLSFNAEDTVNIPSQVVTKAEIDYVNAQLQVAYPADGAYQFMYKLVNGNGYAAQLHYSEDKIAYGDPDKRWTAISAGTKLSDGITLGDKLYMGAYYRRSTTTGLLIDPYGYKTFVVVAFDEPKAAITKLYYKIGDGELVDITDKTEVEVSRGTTNITLVAECENGTVEYSPASLMLDEQTTRGSITATLKDLDGEVAEERTVTFTWKKPAAYLTIESPQFGSGSYKVVYNDDPDNEKSHSGSDTFGPTFYEPGESVVLIAEAGEGQKFKFWEIKSKSGVWSIYNKNPEVKVEIPSDIVLRPAFANTGEKTVVFLGYQNETCGIVTVDNSDLDSPETVVLPDKSEVSPRYGYNFVGWKCEAYCEEVLAAGETISAKEIIEDLTFEAVYELDTSKPKYKLTVEGGVIESAEGTTEECFYFNERVVVTAEATNDKGKIFQYWEDEKTGKAISYNSTYAFYMIAANRELVAVYGENAPKSEPAYTLTVSVLDEGATDGPIFGLFAERRIPTGYIVVENGIVVGYKGNNYGFEECDESVTLDSYNKWSKSKYQNNNGIFFVQLQLTTAEKAKGEWYANAYITYKEDPASEPTTVYSPKVKIAAGKDGESTAESTED